MTVARALKPALCLFILGCLLIAPIAARADDPLPEFTITLKDNQFTPNNLAVPADQRFKLVVTNEQNITAEFESSDFDREKIVPANDSITVFIGPLSKGTYTYFNDFHRDTTGTLTAK